MKKGKGRLAGGDHSDDFKAWCFTVKKKDVRKLRDRGKKKVSSFTNRQQREKRNYTGLGCEKILRTRSKAFPTAGTMKDAGGTKMTRKRRRRRTRREFENKAPKDFGMGQVKINERLTQGGGE